jgi:hypothetical protein
MAASFQSYLDAIEAKTGRTIDDLKRMAEEKSFTEAGRLSDGVKAGDILAWGKGELGLGHGHAMALYALLSGKRKPGD